LALFAFFYRDFLLGKRGERKKKGLHSSTSLTSTLLRKRKRGEKGEEEKEKHAVAWPARTLLHREPAKINAIRISHTSSWERFEERGEGGKKGQLVASRD